MAIRSFRVGKRHSCLTLCAPAPLVSAMTGREFVVELERHGFAIKRRCRSFVWIARGEQTLMLDEEAIVPTAFLEAVLKPRASFPPPSMRGGPQSSRPISQTMRRLSTRPSGLR